MKHLDMDTVSSSVLKSRVRSSPHSVKQWQLPSIDFHPAITERLLTTTETRFSTWTPITNKISNQQLFQERLNLILHWFDLWTDHQRKQFIHNVLMRCSKSQLKFTRDWFTEVVPVTNLDFTSVLPRCISLYILSFLNPKELSQAAQVSWHWKFLAEQDCLWMPKCVRHGWFLPYSPSDNEYGAWKRHYVACVMNLDYLTPREAADIYGTLNEPKEEAEELEERLRERMIRKTIREKVTEYKKASLKSRPAWLSNSWTAGMSKVQSDNLQAHLKQEGLTAALVLLGEKTRSQWSLSKLLAQENQGTLQKQLLVTSLKSLPKRKNVSSGSPYPVPPQRMNTEKICGSPPCQSALHVLLVSSRVPGYEMLLYSTKVRVVPLLYDYCGTTLEALLYRVEQALQGQVTQSVGIFTEGNPGEIALLQDCTITERTVLSPKVREFWEKLSGYVSEGGSVDIFFPLAVSEPGKDIISKISTLTGLDVSTPIGITTGSYHHILSEWLGRTSGPCSSYFNEAPLLWWCRQAERLDQILKSLGEQMRPQLCELQAEMCGRVIGQFLFDAAAVSEIHADLELTRALTEGLAELSRDRCENPLEFLSDFLQRRAEGGSGEKSHKAFLTECDPGNLTEHPKSVAAQVGSADRRTVFARELLHSERGYVQLLEVIRHVYVRSLRAALSSNRAILSSSSVLIIFTDILDILEINSQFLEELTERLQEWGPAQCVGDVCVKFGARLRSYTNFFNNYSTIVRTIDKCRETIPSFRAFLKRHDKTLGTKMMSLHDLLLLPSTRFEEYLSLLHGVSSHTPPEHPDHAHLSSALDTLTRYRDFIRQLKQTVNGDSKMMEAQKMIQSCPNLMEANRYLIRIQDVAQLSSPDKEINASLRIYEHVSDLSLFLFNDALVICSRHISHVPFEHGCKRTLVFLASVALHRLAIADITDTKYVKNAFALQGPKRQWICATEREEDKFTWISALQSAVNAAIEKH
uniref:Epithelial cell transforming 2 like n=1 Tax=Lepisosteus oculatus TaxID=7918 RepID=W5NFM6_LEPOC|nr:PREDICTED: epithelial cell-transforming sequence 2 oncogene-like isoform X1 [Lepisosteus oculatus]